MQANTFEFTGKQFYLQIACFTALLYFTCMVQTYNNSYTRFDWYEHYYRARQILGDFSLYEKIQSPVGPYHYLARPPLQNFIVAIFLGIFGKQFYVYQIIMLCLNFIQIPALIYLSNVIQHFRNDKNSNILCANIMILFTPFIIWNTLYPWTRGFCNSLIIFGFTHVLIALNNEDYRNNLKKIFLLFGCACIVHYSAVPYAIGAVIVLILKSNRKSLVVKNLIYFIAPPLCWFLIAISLFDFNSFYSTNTTYEWSAQITPFDNLIKVSQNIVCSFAFICPYLSNLDMHAIKYSDILFHIYNRTVTGQIGFFGLATIFCLQNVKRNYIYILVPLYFILIGLNGNFSLFGLFHITGQPLCMIALTYLFLNAPKISLFQIFLRALDFLLGVYLGLGVMFSPIMEEDVNFWHLKQSEVIRVQDPKIVYIHDIIFTRK